MEAFGNTPGVAAFRIKGGNQFGLSRMDVGGDAIIGGDTEVIQGKPRFALEQLQASTFEQQVDVVNAVDAVPGGPQTVGDRGIGLLQELVRFLTFWSTIANC